MAVPRGKRHSGWIADSGAERDAITAADGLQVGDLCSVHGVMWHWNGVAWVVEGGGTSARYISIADLGAVVGGDAGDNADAFQAAIDQCAGSSVYSTVLIPGRTGDWNMGHEIQMKDGVRVLGEGPNSRISFVGAAGSFTHDGEIWAQGSAVEVEPILDDSNEGERFITVTEISGPTDVVSGDLVLLYDPTNSSWDNHSSSQRSGEFAEVASVGSGKLHTVQARIDTYLSSSPTETHNVTPVMMTFENITVVGRGNAATAAIWIDFGRDISFLNCEIIQSGGGHGLWLSRSFHVQVVGCDISMRDTGGQKVCIIDHCQDVLFRDCNTNTDNTSGRGIQVGLANVEKTGAFPSRFVRIEGGTHQSPIFTVFLGPHSDLCEITGGIHEGDVLLSGARHTVRGTRFHRFGFGTCIDASTGDWHFFSFTIEGCTFSANPTNATARCIHAETTNNDDIDRLSNAIVIRNNKFTMPESPSSNPAIEMLFDGDVGPRRIIVEDNEITGSDTGEDYLIDIGTGVSYGTGVVVLEDVSISGNKILRGGIRSYVDCKHTTVEGNKITDARAHAIRLFTPGTNKSANHTTHVIANAVYDCAFNFVNMFGYGNTITRLFVVGNSVDGFGVDTVSLLSPVSISQCKACTVQGNSFGGGGDDDIPVCVMNDVIDLYWGGNSFPGLGTNGLVAPASFVVTNFYGDTWTHTESLRAFTTPDRHIAWGTDNVSVESAPLLAKIRHSHDVWLMEIRLVATSDWEDVIIKVFFNGSATPEVTSATMTKLEGVWFVYRPLLYVPKQTDVRVDIERGFEEGTEDALATVTWLNVGLGGGALDLP